MIESIDHIVLTIKDLNKTVFFYCELLGMKLEEFKLDSNSAVRKYLKFFFFFYPQPIRFYT